MVCKVELTKKTLMKSLIYGFWLAFAGGPFFISKAFNFNSYHSNLASFFGVQVVCRVFLRTTYSLKEAS